MFGDYADNVYNRLVKEKGMKSIETIKCNSIFYTEYVLKNSVFIPFLKGSHYLLIMLNISEETFTLFDPYGETLDKDIRFIVQKLKRLSKVCNKGTMLHNIENKKWKIRHYNKPRPLQSDGFNCGVFVLYYMFCLGNEIQMNENFDPNEYRITIARTLLKNSKSMKDICLYCFIDKRSSLVMCKFCRRYAYINCIPGPRKSIEEWSRPDIEFKCTLCIRDIREWMINKDK